MRTVPVAGHRDIHPPGPGQVQSETFEELSHQTQHPYTELQGEERPHRNSHAL